LDTDFTPIFDAFREWIEKNMAHIHIPKKKSEGGSIRDDLILHNLKGRLRMVLSYLLAQLIPLK